MCVFHLCLEKLTDFIILITKDITYMINRNNHRKENDNVHLKFQITVN
jgi:hypothetical protein